MSSQLLGCGVELGATVHTAALSVDHTWFVFLFWHFRSAVSDYSSSHNTAYNAFVAVYLFVMHSEVVPIT